MPWVLAYNHPKRYYSHTTWGRSMVCCADSRHGFGDCPHLRSKCVRLRKLAFIAVPQYSASQVLSAFSLDRRKETPGFWEIHPASNWAWFLKSISFYLQDKKHLEAELIPFNTCPPTPHKPPLLHDPDILCQNTYIFPRIQLLINCSSRNHYTFLSLSFSICMHQEW